MAVDKSDEEAYRQQMAEFDMNEQAQWSMYHQAKRDGDTMSQGEAMRLAFRVRQEREEFYRQAQAATAAPPQRYVSDQQRSARDPGEMDVYDWAKVAGISPEEYYRQFQRLGEYKRQRGDEKK